MFNRFVLAAALTSASLVALVPAASAQSYGGLTLSFGSGGYDRYHGDGYREHYRPRYSPYDYDRADAWRARQRYDQHERWEQQRARREYWRHERNEHRRWDWDRHDDD